LSQQLHNAHLNVAKTNRSSLSETDGVYTVVKIIRRKTTLRMRGTYANSSLRYDVTSSRQQRKQRLWRQQPVDVMNVSVSSWNIQLCHVYLSV